MPLVSQRWPYMSKRSNTMKNAKDLRKGFLDWDGGDRAMVWCISSGFPTDSRGSTLMSSWYKLFFILQQNHNPFLL